MIELNSSGDQSLSEKGQSIAYEIKQSQPRAIIPKIGKTIGVIIIMTVIAGTLGIDLTKTSAVTAVGAVWIMKIWEVTPFKRAKASASKNDIVINKHYK